MARNQYQSRRQHARKSAKKARRSKAAKRRKAAMAKGLTKKAEKTVRKIVKSSIASSKETIRFNHRFAAAGIAPFNGFSPDDSPTTGSLIGVCCAIINMTPAFALKKEASAIELQQNVLNQYDSHQRCQLNPRFYTGQTGYWDKIDSPTMGFLPYIVPNGEIDRTDGDQLTDLDYADGRGVIQGNKFRYKKDRWWFYHTVQDLENPAWYRYVHVKVKKGLNSTNQIARMFDRGDQTGRNIDVSRKDGFDLFDVQQQWEQNLTDATDSPYTGSTRNILRRSANDIDMNFWITNTENAKVVKDYGFKWIYPQNRMPVVEEGTTNTEHPGQLFTTKYDLVLDMPVNKTVDLEEYEDLEGADLPGRIQVSKYDHYMLIFCRQNNYRFGEAGTEVTPHDLAVNFTARASSYIQEF